MFNYRYILVYIIVYSNIYYDDMMYFTAAIAFNDYNSDMSCTYKPFCHIHIAIHLHIFYIYHIILSITCHLMLYIYILHSYTC